MLFQWRESFYIISHLNLSTLFPLEKRISLPQNNHPLFSLCVRVVACEMVDLWPAEIWRLTDGEANSTGFPFLEMGGMGKFLLFPFQNRKELGVVLQRNNPTHF
ncbi:hypothetical protein OWV82_005090 [Melia azedarach]|uniref:Uncharacterized protein n=1 Tax=Melia azedarach TaxID=155640 RepID=A0ACC1YRL2_MELAZ|nr:hypothetical protein OWV82_005090 [Melia azedarach]